MSTSSATTESPSSSPADENERPRPAAGPSGRSKDDITVVQVPAFPPVPSFLSADASRHSVDGERAGRAPAATPTLEAEVKRLQMALNTTARYRPAQRRGSTAHPGRAVPGVTGSGLLTALLSRPASAVGGMAVASVMIAAVAGTYVYVSMPQGDDWDLAALPPSRPSLPDAATGANGGEPGLQVRPAPPFLPAQPDTPPAENKIEMAELQTAPDRPAMREQVAVATPEPAKLEAPVTMAPEPAPPASSEPPAMAAPESENPERAVIMAQVVAPAAPPELAPPAREEAPHVPAPPPLAPPPLAPPVLAPPPLPEPPAMAAPAPATSTSHESFTMAAREPVPAARSELPPDLTAGRRTPPQAGRPLALGPAAHTPGPVALAPGPAARANFQFADSSVRYLTGAELQRLSPDRLRIARNEIFARKGRLFKDDALRAYFSQFAWYQPRAWDVPLSPVEVANVGVIQSVEDAAVAHTRSIGEPVPVETEPGTRVVGFPDPHRQYLTSAELQGLSTDELVLVRNEIFARRGRYFRDPALRAYFERFPWYQPYAWDVPLSPVERANVETIQAIEQARGGHLPPT